MMQVLAYIDPASGSILLQVILAGAVGAMGYFFRPIARIFRFLTGRKSSPVDADPDADETSKKPPRG